MYIISCVRDRIVTGKKKKERKDTRGFEATTIVDHEQSFIFLEGSKANKPRMCG